MGAFAKVATRVGRSRQAKRFFGMTGQEVADEVNYNPEVLERGIANLGQASRPDKTTINLMRKALKIVEKGEDAAPTTTTIKAKAKSKAAPVTKAKPIPRKGHKGSTKTAKKVSTQTPTTVAKAKPIPRKGRGSRKKIVKTTEDKGIRPDTGKTTVTKGSLSKDINDPPKGASKATLTQGETFKEYVPGGGHVAISEDGVERYYRGDMAKGGIIRKQGGRIMKKANGGKMSHVGLYPAEEARSGTMSEAKRKKYAKKGGPVKKYHKGKQIKAAKEILKTHELVGKEGLSGRYDTETKKTKPYKHKSGGVVKKKTGGAVKKQAGGPFKQGYKAREDESLGMRTGPESGKTQSLAARRDESYGDWGKRKRGRVNVKKGGSVRKLKKGGQVRKMSEGGTLVASLYETIS